MLKQRYLATFLFVFLLVSCDFSLERSGVPGPAGGGERSGNSSGGGMNY